MYGYFTKIFLTERLRSVHGLLLPKKCAYCTCTQIRVLHFFHETAICHNQTIHGFTGDGEEKIDRLLIDQPKLVMVSSKYKEKRFLWTQHFERRCVSNKRPTINNRISVSEIGWVTTNCCCMSDLLKYIRNICK